MASFTILEPISTGDVIDRAVRLYRRNFLPLISIAAVPTLIGYFVSILFWSGYSSMLNAGAGNRNVPVSSIVLIMVGVVGYPIWGYAFLLTISGLSRVVGDHIMLSEPITFRGWFAAVRRRLGAITLMGLILIAMLAFSYFVILLLFFLLFLVVTLIVGVLAAASLPQWLTTTVLVLAVIAVVAFALLVVCTVVARIVFLPQVVMIEGQSAGSGLGRAFGLGKGNWYRVGAIGLFSYFVSASLLAAMSFPVLTALYLSGVLTAEFFVGPTWNILYTSFGQIANLMSLPISIVSFTLLYFDSRVRKEAYDLDLIAREINPGFFWEPPTQNSAFGYQHPPGHRPFVQTSPLGLAGLQPPPRPPVNLPTQAEATESIEDSQVHSEAPQAIGDIQPIDASAYETDAINTESLQDPVCESCGAALIKDAPFCINCGRSTGGALRQD